MSRKGNSAGLGATKARDVRTAHPGTRKERSQSARLAARDTPANDLGYGFGNRTCVSLLRARSGFRRNAPTTYTCQVRARCLCTSVSLQSQRFCSLRDSSQIYAKRVSGGFTARGSGVETFDDRTRPRSSPFISSGAGRLRRSRTIHVLKVNRDWLTDTTIAVESPALAIVGALPLSQAQNPKTTSARFFIAEREGRASRPTRALRRRRNAQERRSLSAWHTTGHAPKGAGWVEPRLRGPR
jgi:hypothetical protein